MLGAKVNGVGLAAREVVERFRSIVRLEVELAALELKRKIAKIALGAGLAVGGALVAVFALGFLIAGAAAAIAIALPVWASLLIVGGGLLALSLLLLLLGRSALKKGTPPVPQEAIEEARLTTEALRHDGQ